MITFKDFLSQLKSCIKINWQYKSQSGSATAGDLLNGQKDLLGQNIIVAQHELVVPGDEFSGYNIKLRDKFVISLGWHVAKDGDDYMFYRLFGNLELSIFKNLEELKSSKEDFDEFKSQLSLGIVINDDEPYCKTREEKHAFRRYAFEKGLI